MPAENRWYSTPTEFGVEIPGDDRAAFISFGTDREGVAYVEVHASDEEPYDTYDRSGSRPATCRLTGEDAVDFMAGLQAWVEQLSSIVDTAKPEQ